MRAILVAIILAAVYALAEDPISVTDTLEVDPVGDLASAALQDAKVEAAANAHMAQLPPYTSSNSVDTNTEANSTNFLRSRAEIKEDPAPAEAADAAPPAPADGEAAPDATAPVVAADNSTSLTPVNATAADAGEVPRVIDFLKLASSEDGEELRKAAEEAETRIKAMKLAAVEKESAIDALIKKEDALQKALAEDQKSITDLQSHVKSINARSEKLKKQKQIRLLEQQFHKFAAESSLLKSKATNMEEVKNSLFAKMKYLNDMIAPLQEAETTNLRLSIDSANKGDIKAPADLLAAAPAAAPAAPPA